MTILNSWSNASDGERYVLQQIPIEIQKDKVVSFEIRSISGNGWNQVGLRCAPEVCKKLVSRKDDIDVRIVASNKRDTSIINVSPGDRGLWPVDSFFYLFSIGGKYRATATIEITFKNAPDEATRAEILVLKTPSDTGL